MFGCVDFGGFLMRGIDQVICKPRRYLLFSWVPATAKCQDCYMHLQDVLNPHIIYVSSLQSSVTWHSTQPACRKTLFLISDLNIICPKVFPCVLLTPLQIRLVLERFLHNTEYSTLKQFSEKSVLAYSNSLLLTKVFEEDRGRAI